MAKTTNQSILRGLEGKLGNIVTRTVNDKTVISKAPKRRTKKSSREAANHSLFQQAAAFAVEAMRDPDVKLYFQNEAENRKLPNGYTAALSTKLKELNAAAKERAKQSSTAFNHDDKTSTDINTSKNFAGACKHTENTIGDALYLVSRAWHNIERNELDERQREVLRSIARAQICKWLEFANRAPS